jgi:hypothetical protein
LPRRAVQALHPPHFNFFRRRRRRQILIQFARLRFGDMPVGEPADDDALFASVRPADHELVAHAQQPVRLGGLAVDVDLAALARLLRLGSRAEQARDIEPDVQADAGGYGIIHGNTYA